MNNKDNDFVDIPKERLIESLERQQGEHAQITQELKKEYPQNLISKQKNIQVLGLLTAVISLFSLLIFTAVLDGYSYYIEIIAFNFPLGILFGCLLLIAAGSISVAIVYEIIGWRKLNNFSSIRKNLQDALVSGDLGIAKINVRLLEQVLRKQNRFRIEVVIYSEYQEARKFLVHAEESLLEKLDSEVEGVIQETIRRVAALTAISSSPSMDILVVAFLNFKMISSICKIYQGHLGVIGIWRLYISSYNNLIAAGALSFSSKALTKTFGEEVSTKLVGKFLEAATNGFFTAKLGIAAVDGIRPMPFAFKNRPTPFFLLKNATLSIFKDEN
jgi:putative membrane protein